MRRIPSKRFEPRVSISNCPVCQIVFVRQGSCCSSACNEVLSDAQDKLEFIRVRNSDLHAELNELQEVLGCIQNQLEFTESELKCLGMLWSKTRHLALDSKFESLEKKEKSTHRRLARLSRQYQRLNSKWKKLVIKKERSDKELSDLEAMIKKC